MACACLSIFVAIAAMAGVDAGAAPPSVTGLYQPAVSTAKKKRHHPRIHHGAARRKATRLPRPPASAQPMVPHRSHQERTWHPCLGASARTGHPVSLRATVSPYCKLARLYRRHQDRGRAIDTNWSARFTPALRKPLRRHRPGPRSPPPPPAHTAFRPHRRVHSPAHWTGTVVLDRLLPPRTAPFTFTPAQFQPGRLHRPSPTCMAATWWAVRKPQGNG